MKHTSLFCAVALAAAMGTQAFASESTNQPIAQITFDNYQLGELAAATSLYEHWTIQNDDKSAIIAAPLSSSSSTGDTNRHLRLSTEGQELVYGDDVTFSEEKAIVEMKVNLVASDTPPSITNKDVHAAVYLRVSEPADDTVDGLYALAKVNGDEAAWTKLDTTGIGSLASGSNVALRVVMDYKEQKVTYYGARFIGETGAYDSFYALGVNLDMANPDETVTHLTSVAFRGTGGVDDLFITEVTVTPSQATVDKYTVYDESAVYEQTYSFSPNYIDVDALDGQAGSFVEGSVDFLSTFFGTVVKSITLYDVTTTTNECSWITGHTPTVNPSTGDFQLTKANYNFQPEHTYWVRIVVGDESSEPTYTGPKSGALQILNAADGQEYGQGFIPLRFTNIVVSASAVTAYFEATIAIDDEPASMSASFGVLTCTDLGDSTTEATLTGTVTSDANGTGGVVTIPLPQSDSLFIQGFTEAPVNN